MKYLLLILTLQAHAFSSKVASPTPIDPTSGWKACKVKVLNRGIAPDWFLNEALAWAKTAPDEIFASNSNYDVYSLMYAKLGPWKSLKHRKAALLNGLIIHAGMESSWNHSVGIDTSKPSSLNTCKAAEAGAYQPSYDSVYGFGGDLISLFKAKCSSFSADQDCKRFQICAKQNRSFSHEYTSRLLRHKNGYKHFGPWVRGENQRYLSVQCTEELLSKL
jgi:hypothetical protein